MHRARLGVGAAPASEETIIRAGDLVPDTGLRVALAELLEA